MPIDANNSSAPTPGNQLGAIGNIRKGINDRANAWIVSPNTPKGIVTLGEFAFDIEDSYSVTAENEVTDYYTERNKNFSDNIVRRPLEVTVRGFVGELVRKKADGLSGALSIIQDRLGVVPAYLTKYTPFQLQKIQKTITQAENTVTKVDQALSRVDSIVSGRLFKGISAGETKQAQAFRTLLEYRDKGQIFSIDGPYGRLTKTENGQRSDRCFVIRRIVFTQEGDTRMISDIALTLREINFLVDASDNTANMSPRAAAGRATRVNHGVTKGVFVPYDADKLKAGAGMKVL